MRLSRLHVILLLCPTLLAQGSHPETPTAKAAVIRKSDEWKAAARQLIAQATAKSGDASAGDRAFLLARAAAASAQLNADQSKAWANDAFQLATQQRSPVKERVQVAAINALAQNDIEAGLGLLSRMQAPAAQENGQAPPDMRSGIAAMLLQKLWQQKSKEAVPTIQRTAAQLGETGNYPYMAIGMLVRSIQRANKELAQGLVNDAINYLSRRRATAIEDQQLAMFLRSSSDLISGGLMKDTLERLVKEAVTQKDTGGTMAMDIETDGKKAELTSASSILLFQLLPIIRQTDAEWAKKLEEQYAELRQVAELQNGQNQRMMVGMMVRAGDGGEGPRDPREEMAAIQVDELSKTDPQEALRRSEGISNPFLRAASQAGVAAELSKSDPARAAELVKNARAAMAESQDPREKMQIVINLARAQAASGDKEGWRESVRAGFAMGDEMFRKGVDRRPTAPAFAQAGYELLSRLTRATVETDLALTTERIASLHSPTLQALMLVTAAEALNPAGDESDGGVRIRIEN